MIRPRQARCVLLALGLLAGAGAPAEGKSADGPSAWSSPAPDVEPIVEPSAIALPDVVATPSAWETRIEGRLRELAGSRRQEQRVSVSPSRRAADLLAELQRIATAAERKAEIGVAVKELDSGTDVFRWHADRTLNPASNHKLVTAIAAVELLGADYRFATRVFVKGRALYVVGEGDPSLQLEDVAGLAARAAMAIDPAGIDRIVVDDGFFSARRQAPGYEDSGAGVSYLAPSGALSLQFNTVEISVVPGAAGHAPTVSVRPECPHVRIDNRATTARGGSLAIETHGEGEHTVVTVSGHIRETARPVRMRRRIDDPGLYFGTAFADRFAAMTDGVVRPVTRGTTPQRAALLVEHESARLPDVLTSALAFSNNFTTEQVLRTLGARATGRPGDWDNGRATVERFWGAIGRSPDELVFVNASGFSRSGRISADALVDLIALTGRSGSPSAELVSALAAPGEHGTLRDRLRRARGHVRAKTGTLRGASGLSGIVQADDGRRYGFSILLNGRISSDGSRRVQDRIVTALVDHLL